ncbi:n-alkane-inducible cytochrome P450 [Penicillium angulare]|uniref:n-alkane-inducible cytochrome P450 n=1 Tax=Penicillium angulare TaxID=116970 RepID=UPI002542039B|nr:n-alkane-inducible cytochrome P450 [Penicillium angulare]KAJ5266785.1 n-alkane-inducible cytochrome P450 [Penicillium angulare]
MGRSMIETIDPVNIQAVLAHQFEDFDLGSRNDCMRPLLGEGIFASDGPVWEHSRALLRPNFVRAQVSDMNNVYEKHVSRLIRKIPVDGSTTIDSATEFLFGKSVDTLLANESNSTANSTSNAFAQDFQISQAGILLRIRLGGLKAFYRDKAFTKATEDSREYCMGIVREALANRDSPKSSSDQSYVFLHELMKQSQDEKMLADQLLNLLLAGRDSTAGLLSILFLTLAKRQDILLKLREEVLPKLDGRKPSFEDLKSMTYLTWCLKETLRVYPIVPINVRVANKNTTLPTGGGPNGNLPLFIPKGQEVMYSSFSIHRLPEVFGEDAEEFRPERWEGLKPGWAYTPFSGGPRICLGQQFAMTEAAYTTVRILQEFDHIESRDPEPFKENVTLTLASQNGTKVALTSSQKQ